jgi:Uma2 family endonuclease
LGTWLDEQPEPRGELLAGEVGCRLQRNPDVTIGIDLVYLGPELASVHPEDCRVIDGIPTLAAEIFSPSDKFEDINEKLDEYLAHGVTVVWFVDPHFSNRDRLSLRCPARPV